jgi:hypothetical protein
LFAAKYDWANRNGRQGCPLFWGRVKKSVFVAALGRRLFLAIRMGRTRSRGDDDPRTYDEHYDSYGAIAPGLRLL